MPYGPDAGGSAPASRKPRLALAAGFVGILGALPSVLLALLVLGLDGWDAITEGAPWTWLVLIAPLVQLSAAFWLLAGRGWWPMAVAWLPIALFIGAVAVAAADTPEGGTVALPLLQLVLPLLAAVLASTRRVRRWIAARKEDAGGS